MFKIDDLHGRYILIASVRGQRVSCDDALAAHRR